MRWNTAPSFARADATRRSHASASDSPAPMHAPSIAATIGFGRSRMARITCASACSCARRSAGPSASRSGMVFTSPPAEKQPPAPVTSSARTASSAAARATHAATARHSAGPSALRTSGRSSVTIATFPSTA